MRLLGLCFVLITLFLGACAHPEAGHAPASVRQKPAGNFEALLSAVVRIDVREANYENGARQIARGTGSGVIMTPDGYILTNAHVVSPDAEDIVVTLANLERVDATLVGWDHWTDLALIRLDMEAVRRRGLGFTHARFGDSASLSPGTPVLAVGTPNGLTRTVTRGIISNAQRYFAATSQIRGYETGYFNTWLQTDAAINPGNSGGPLVTEQGRVVGINTRSYLGANNLSFAVPAATAREVMEALLRDGSVTRSYLGLRPAPMQDLEAFFGLDANIGMLVDSVDPGSPAAAVGLRAGDIVLRIDGAAVDGRFPEQLPAILHGIAARPVGSALTLTIKRGEETRELALTTEKLESRMGEQTAFEKWGLSVQKLTRAIAREERMETADGVLVLGLQRAFPAMESGLLDGDLIVAANRKPVRGLDDLRAIYEEFENQPERVFVEIRRNHQAQFLVIKPR